MGGVAASGSKMRTESGGTGRKRRLRIRRLAVGSILFA